VSTVALATCNREYPSSFSSSTDRSELSSFKIPGKFECGVDQFQATRTTRCWGVVCEKQRFEASEQSGQCLDNRQI